MALPHMASSNQQQFKIGYIPWWSFPKNELRVHSNNNTWWILLKMWDRMNTLRCFPGSLSLTDKQSPINDWWYQRRRAHNNQSTRESKSTKPRKKYLHTEAGAIIIKHQPKEKIETWVYTEYPCPLSESKVKTHSIPFKSSVTHLLVAHEKEGLLRTGKKSVILQHQGSRKSDQSSSDLIRMMISCNKLHILVHFLQSYGMLWLLQVQNPRRINLPRVASLCKKHSYKPCLELLDKGIPLRNVLICGHDFCWVCEITVFWSCILWKVGCEKKYLEISIWVAAPPYMILISSNSKYNEQSSLLI